MRIEYASTYHMDDAGLSARAAKGWELVCCGQWNSFAMLYWRRSVPEDTSDVSDKGPGTTKQVHHDPL